MEKTLEDPKDCEHCQNFFRHYVLCQDGYVPIRDGHCAVGRRVKRVKVDATCGNYAKRSAEKSVYK